MSRTMSEYKKELQESAKEAIKQEKIRKIVFGILGNMCNDKSVNVRKLSGDVAVEFAKNNKEALDIDEIQKYLETLFLSKGYQYRIDDDGFIYSDQDHVYKTSNARSKAERDVANRELNQYIEITRKYVDDLKRNGKPVTEEAIRLKFEEEYRKNNFDKISKKMPTYPVDTINRDVETDTRIDMDKYGRMISLAMEKVLKPEEILPENGLSRLPYEVLR